MEWFKFYQNKWLTDRAIARLRPQDRLCFLTLLCVTAQSDERNGTVTQYDEREIITLTHLSVDVSDESKSDYHRAIGFTDRLCEVGLIVRNNDGSICIPNFEKRQNSNLSGAERAKKYREKSSVTNVTQKSDESNAREEKIREDKRRVEKKEKYGDNSNVLLTLDEHQKLCELLSPQVVETLIGELDLYIGSKGVRYKSHYLTIQAWARRRIQEHATKVLSAKPKSI